MKSLIYILAILLIAINVLLNVKLSQSKQNTQYEKKNTQFFSDFAQSLKFNNRVTYQYQNSLISNPVLLDENGDTCRLSDLIREKTLIVRYSHLSCDQCVDSIFSIINSMPFDNCLILAEYDNPQSLGAFYRTNQPEYPLLNCKEAITSFDTLNIPYVFLTDTSLRLSSLFVPVKEDMKYTQECFSALLKSIENLPSLDKKKEAYKPGTHFSSIKSQINQH